MDDNQRMADFFVNSSRGRLIMTAGVVLLAGAFLVLCLPVFLGDLDEYGFQIKCGNGFQSQLVQATVAGGRWAAAHPDAEMHDAALLDRRDSSHREQPPNTTF